MRLASVEQAVEAQVRAAVCSQCPRRPFDFGPATAEVTWRCQEACPVFEMLPSLIRRAQLLDSMIQSTEVSLRDRIELAAVEEAGRLRRNLLRRSAPAVARIVANVVEGH